MARKPLKRGQQVLEWSPTLLQRVKGDRPNQVAYLKSMAENSITFGLGKSGTGKSYMAAGFAAGALVKGQFRRIVLSRPLSQCGGNNLGYLPGDAGEKISPFMAPLMDAMEAFFSKSDLDKLIESEVIQVVPLELMRGSSFKDSVILIDEAQNCSKIQLEMALTRLDHGSKLIFTGDERQSDIGKSPLLGIVDQLVRSPSIESIGVVRFTAEDNMRSGIVSAICNRLGL